MTVFTVTGGEMGAPPDTGEFFLTVSASPVHREGAQAWGEKEKGGMESEACGSQTSKLESGRVTVPTEFECWLRCTVLRLLYLNSHKEDTRVP